MKFEGENILEFADKFSDVHSCSVYSETKLANGFTCKKYGHNKFSVRKKNLTGVYNRYHHVVSLTADILFPPVRFGIRKAFGIVFEMNATTKSLSSPQVATISRTTARSPMHKVRSAIKSNKSYPLEEEVRVDEFVFGGKENLKQGKSTDSREKEHIEKYSDEFSYQINRSTDKQTIFHYLLSRMLNAQPITYQMIKIST